VARPLGSLRIIEIQAGAHTITAADPLPDDLRHALDRIHANPPKCRHRRDRFEDVALDTML